MTSEEKMTYMTHVELKTRDGWSAKVIRTELGDPVKINSRKRNPAMQERLYLISDIKDVEASGRLIRLNKNDRVLA